MQEAESPADSSAERFLSAFSSFAELGYKTIRELETEHGILASGKDEIYGCVFGRDSLITSHKLLQSYRKIRDPYLLGLVRKVLLGLMKLQGTSINIESGEEPGKCIHEYRPADHERLTKAPVHPWYVYPDQAMRNYDSVDATPLFLIVLHEYHELSGDEAFLEGALPHVRAALDWIFKYGDHNGDGFIDYWFHPDRIHGGLRTQSWMDSTESVFHEDGSEIAYPIAPVEVQAYTFAALRRWAGYFRASSESAFAEELASRAEALKQRFNQTFILPSVAEELTVAFALDGHGRSLAAARSSMGHVLWAAVPENGMNGIMESILDKDLVPKLVKRLLAPDLFEPNAGIRTLSMRTARFDPMSYHNGSIWPHDTGMCIEGLANFGYVAEATMVRGALLRAYDHFHTPIELFAFADGQYLPYRAADGHGACEKQAWSAAVLLRESLENLDL